MKKILIQSALILAASGALCWGQLLDPLHGYCSVGCIDNGSNSPTSQNPILGFGFTVSPGPASGDLLIDVLEPSNEAHAPVGITGTVSGTASLFSATAWSSGDLDAFLGISASPTNPIGAFAGSTDTGDTGSTGFFVYQLDLGTLTLQSPSNPNVSPLENIVGGLPIGSYIVGFLNEGTVASPDWVATANSGAILETSPPTTPSVPEPSSIILLGSAALGVGTLLKRKTHGRA